LFRGVRPGNIFTAPNALVCSRLEWRDSRFFCLTVLAAVCDCERVQTIVVRQERVG
jgi:hypothetical protein